MAADFVVVIVRLLCARSSCSDWKSGSEIMAIRSFKSSDPFTLGDFDAPVLFAGGCAVRAGDDGKATSADSVGCRYDSG